jgi:plastocyanin
MRIDVRNARGVTMLALALSLAACGGKGGGPTAVKGVTGNTGGTGGTPSTSSSIAIGSALSFTPSATTVPNGTTVTWNWDSCTGDGYGGQTCVEHNVTWDDGSAPPSPSQSAGTYTRAFAAPGTYSYHCSIHGTASSGMRGTITVQ